MITVMTVVRNPPTEIGRPEACVYYLTNQIRRYSHYLWKFERNDLHIQRNHRTIYSRRMLHVHTLLMQMRVNKPLDLLGTSCLPRAQ